MEDHDGKFLRISIRLARISVRKGGFPAGALVVKNGKIIATATSVGNLINDPSAHAETVAIRRACKKLKSTSLKGAVLYESLQACTMCFSVAYWAGITKIVSAAEKTPSMVKKGYYEGKSSAKILNKDNNRHMELVLCKEMEEASLAVVKEWEKAHSIR